MAYTLTKRTKLLSQQVNVEPNIILEIDGIPYVFGAVPVTREVRYGDDVTFGDEGLVYGGVVKQSNQLDWISLQGTSTSISQKIDQEKNGSSSVQSMKVRIIDKDNFLTKIFSPDDTVPDLLARDAAVYMAFANGSHPEDSIKLLQGVISNYDFGAGYCVVTISHPEQLKRQEILPEITTKLNGAIDSVTTSITLNDTTGLVAPANALRSFVRIDDEVIEYTGYIGNVLSGVTRGALGTTAAAHDNNAETKSNYRLDGTTTELALKLYLSDDGNTNFDDEETTNIVRLSATEVVNNAILLGQENPEDKLGLVVGDLCSLSGSTQDFTDQPIASFGQISNGAYYVIVSGVTLVEEIGITATVSFKSKYNVLPTGLGLNPKQVDVPQFELIEALFNSQFPNYEFLIKETLKAKDFIDQEVLFTSSLYTIPRKGKISCNITVPPLAVLGTKTLDSSNILNPDKIIIKRSFNKYFYNAIVYKYAEDVLEDKFLAGRITQSADSTNRIKVGNRPLTIESKGLIDNPVTEQQLDIISTRLLDRYKFGAEFLSLKVNFKTGFNMEVGDTTILDGTDLQISDSRNGTRTFQPRIFEVVNKKLNYKTGDISVDLVDTAFELDGRYTTFSPSSLIDAGSTTTRLILKVSFTDDALAVEGDKWLDYVGQKIQVRTQDYATVYETEITGIDPVNENAVTIKVIPAAPSEDWVLEAPPYPTDTDVNNQQYWKLRHASFNPSVVVTNGISATQFQVALADAAKFVIGLKLRIHSEDYATRSSEVIVQNIVGDTITIEDIGFTPSVNQRAELIGFPDSGQPYRYL